jgi:dienelactone hydrolase
MRAWLALLVACLAVPASATDYAAPGPSSVLEVDTSWADTARGRELPLRFRLPESGERLPVIVFSHGLGGSREAGGLEWSTHWASRGFAVLHVQHPGSDEALWRGKPPAERMANLRAAVTFEQFMARIADIRFVVAELSRRRAAGDNLLGRLDPERLGMSGHSFGAATTLYLGGQRAPAPGFRDIDLSEPRFGAFLAFSPQATVGGDHAHQFGAFRRPALMITGSLDGQPFPGLGAMPNQRLEPFEAMAPTGNKFLLFIDQADHMYFNGTPGLRDIGTSGRERVDFAAVEQRGYRLIKAVSTAYWLAYLAADGEALRWLKDGPAAAMARSDGYFRAK